MLKDHLILSHAYHSAFSESSHSVPCKSLSCSNSYSSDATSVVAPLHDSASETSHHDLEQYVKDGCSESGKGNPIHDMANPRGEAILNQALHGKDDAKPNEISNLCEVRCHNVTSSKCSKRRESSKSPDIVASSDTLFACDAQVVLPLPRKQQGQLLTATEERLITPTTDVEDLIARLNIELSVRQYLTTKVMYCTSIHNCLVNSW